MEVGSWRLEVRDWKLEVEGWTACSSVCNRGVDIGHWTLDVGRWTLDIGQMKIAVVGVCASGKSTLVKALRQFGIVAVDVAQEHSLVPFMWEKITRPNVLLYLEASKETVRARWPYKGDVDFWEEQVRRLQHARAHADCIINVDDLTPQQTLALALRQLEVIAAQKFDSPQ